VTAKVDFKFKLLNLKGRANHGPQVANLNCSEKRLLVDSCYDSRGLDKVRKSSRGSK